MWYLASGIVRTKKGGHIWRVVEVMGMEWGRSLTFHVCVMGRGRSLTSHELSPSLTYPDHPGSNLARGVLRSDSADAECPRPQLSP